ncbi:MAG: hypothetical protein CMJ47_11120 [Planctomyces sp.]|nr:hypothetical protein [Planctomyces sp.]
MAEQVSSSARATRELVYLPIFTFFKPPFTPTVNQAYYSVGKFPSKVNPPFGLPFGRKIEFEVVVRAVVFESRFNPEASQKTQSILK